MNKSPKSLKSMLVDGSRVFTVKTKKDVLGHENLCSYCACNEAVECFEECWVSRSPNKKMTKAGVGMEVIYCGIHQPVIGFQAPLIGFENEFNTFRPGRAWKARLAVKNIIGLLDVKTETLFGKAVVTGVDSGTIGYMLDKYAESNHLILEYEGDDKSEKLMSIMKKIYGPGIINADSIVTVISLKRLYVREDTTIV